MEKTVIRGEIKVFNRPATPNKRELSSSKDETAGSKTAEKKPKIESLREAIECTMSDMELYSTSAGYYFTTHQMKEGNEKLEKSKRLVHSNVQKSLFILKGVHGDMASQSQNISTLQQRNNQLQQKLKSVEAERDLLLQETKDLRKEIDQLKEEKEFLSDESVLIDNESQC